MLTLTSYGPAMTTWPMRKATLAGRFFFSYASSAFFIPPHDPLAPDNGDSGVIISLDAPFQDTLPARKRKMFFAGNDACMQA